MKYRNAFFPATFLFAILSFAPAQAFIDVEGGVAFTGYNDLAIPADTGTKFSLSDEITSDPAVAMRLRLGYTFAGRHTVTALYAPLTVHGSGTFRSAAKHSPKAPTWNPCIVSIRTA